MYVNASVPPHRIIAQDFAKAGAGGAGMMFTFHLEAVADPSTLSTDTAHPAVVEMANTVKAAGMKVCQGGRRLAGETQQGTSALHIQRVMVVHAGTKTQKHKRLPPSTCTLA